jgi:hypothetical protein
MTSIQLRKKVAHFIAEKADETLVKMIYALVKTYSEEKQHDLDLSPQQWAEVDRRRNELRSGKVKPLQHAELMSKLKTKLSRNKR